MNTLRTVLRLERGHAMAELALFLPLLAFVIMISLEFSNFFEEGQRAASLAREAAIIGARVCANPKNRAEFRTCFSGQTQGQYRFEMEKTLLASSSDTPVRTIITAFRFDPGGGTPDAKTVPEICVTPFGTCDVGQNPPAQMAEDQDLPPRWQNLYVGASAFSPTLSQLDPGVQRLLSERCTGVVADCYLYVAEVRYRYETIVPQALTRFAPTEIRRTVIF